MPANQFSQTNIVNFQESSSFLERPRLRKLLENAMDYQVVAVYGGAGYGKTRAVYSFLQHIDAHINWLQISESDNVETRFWESFVHTISLSWPEAAERFTEIGFPDSEKAFSRFDAMIHEAYSIPGKHIMVYDDFHLVRNPAILSFLEKAFNALPQGATVILISRTMPEVNLTDMMHERIFTVQEDALCFTEDEIARYFDFLGFSVSRQDIRDIYDDTHGWTFAVNLLGRSLHRDRKYKRYALEAMKTNIYKFIETEITRNISEGLWRLLLKISLIDNHAASLIRTLADDDGLVKEMEYLNAFIRYDHYLGAYMIHHLFIDYLRQYQYRLMENEKHTTWRLAGVWCEKNNFQTDALSYYEKAGDWDAILRIVYTLKFQMPHGLARYIMEILGRMPEDAASQKPLYPAMSIKVRISLGMLKEASVLAFQYTGDYEKRPESPDKNRALAEIYGCWTLLRTIMCPYTDVYDFDVYCEKQRYYYEKSPYQASGPITNLSIGSYALLVGNNRAGAPQEYIEALSRTIPHISHMLNDCLTGLDDLARGELFFFQRELNSAEQALKQALDKARAKRQYDIQSRSMAYLMLVAFSRGEIKTATAYLEQMEMLLDEKDYATRYEIYDVTRGQYHMALGRPEEIPDWLKGDFLPFVHPASIANYTNRVKAQYRYMTQRYNELLAFLENAKETQILLIGKISFKVLEALSLYQIKRREEALSALAEAYELAAPNKIVIPFTQYAKDMRTLTAAALRDDKCPIPKEWLENMNRKASAFSRRQLHMITKNRADNNIDDKITLTKRETEVLKDLSQGLSRTEIAASQNISVNTVKMVINIIYEKLCVTSLPDAIRIAIARKLV